MNTQTRVLEAIKTRIEEAGFDPIINMKWANTGTIQAVEPGEFGAERTAHFDFQDSSCRFDKSNRFCDFVPGTRGCGDYDNPAGMKTLVNSVVAYLTEA